MSDDGTEKLPGIFLRASISDKCNFNCGYCPKNDWLSGGMENYTPNDFVGRALSVEDYKVALGQIKDGLGIRRISFTGGEPTLNPNLPELLRAARYTFDQVEITTNGSLLSDSLVDSLTSNRVDLVKVSLDTLNPQDFAGIVGVRGDRVLEKVVTAIRKLSSRPLKVVLNVVVMKRGLSGLRAVLDFAREVNCDVHLLDYVFYPSKKEDWESQFVPMEFLARVFVEQYGQPEEVVRYGCTFYRFRLGDIYVRFKDSMAGTMRAFACSSCMEYCQEGPYGLKLSNHGWVTACPSIDRAKGVLLSQELNTQEAKDRLAGLLHMFNGATSDPASFEKFLKMWNLRPQVSQGEVDDLFSTETVGPRHG